MLHFPPAQPHQVKPLKIRRFLRKNKTHDGFWTEGLTSELSGNKFSGKLKEFVKCVSEILSYEMFPQRSLKYQLHLIIFIYKFEFWPGFRGNWHYNWSSGEKHNLVAEREVKYDHLLILLRPTLTPQGWDLQKALNTPPCSLRVR